MKKLIFLTLLIFLIFVLRGRGPETLEKSQEVAVGLIDLLANRHERPERMPGQITLSTNHTWSQWVERVGGVSSVGYDFDSIHVGRKVEVKTRFNGEIVSAQILTIGSTVIDNRDPWDAIKFRISPEDVGPSPITVLLSYR